MSTIGVRRVGVLLGGLAAICAAALCGCSSTTEKPGPSAPASSASLSPTEKNVPPTLSPMGPNSPSGRPSSAPTALPGNGITGN